MFENEVKPPLTTSGQLRSASWWKSTGILATGIVLGLGFLVVVALLARPFALLFLAICIAAAIYPLSEQLAHRFNIKRNVAILIIFGIGLLLIGILVALLTTPFILQFRDLAERLPEIINRGKQFLDDNGISNQQLDSLTGQLQSMGQTLLSAPLMVFSAILDAILVVFVTLYLLMDAPKIRRFILSMFAGQTRERIDTVGSEMISKAGGYVRGIVSDMIFVTVIMTIGLSLIGVPFSLALGIIAGLFEIFPTIGPIIASVPVLLVALLQSPTTALLTFIFVLILQQIQGNVITPRVMKEQADVPEFIVPLAIIAGGGAGGVLGAIIAVPLVAMLRVFFLRVLKPLIQDYTGASTLNAEHV